MLDANEVSVCQMRTKFLFVLNLRFAGVRPRSSCVRQQRANRTLHTHSMQFYILSFTRQQFSYMLMLFCCAMFGSSHGGLVTPASPHVEKHLCQLCCCLPLVDCLLLLCCHSPLSNLIKTRTTNHPYSQHGIQSVSFVVIVVVACFCRRRGCVNH